MASTQSLYGFFHQPAVDLGHDPAGVGAVVSVASAPADDVAGVGRRADVCVAGRMGCRRQKSASGSPGRSCWAWVAGRHLAVGEMTNVQ